MNDIADTPERMASRKNDHISLCVRSDVESSGRVPFASLSFLPEALPEMDLSDIDTRADFLGRTFSLPLLITGMTGGVEKGQHINETLALAAQEFGIPMGLGSQKMMVTRPELRRLFDVRPVAARGGRPLFLIGNIGAVSFNYGITLDDVKRIVDDLELDAFAFHLNALQECIQPEGERDFSGLLSHLAAAAKDLPVPVLVKEVGSGLSASTYRRLAETGVAAVDVGGSGGTSWSVIEGLRSDPLGQRLGELFRSWGLTTEESLRACARERARRVDSSAADTAGEGPARGSGNGSARSGGLGRAPALVATGGIRDGVQVAKAVACGATMVGVGLPLLRQVTAPRSGLTPLEALREELEFFSRSLKIAMFCTGARRLADLETRIYGRNDAT